MSKWLGPAAPAATKLVLSVSFTYTRVSTPPLFPLVTDTELLAIWRNPASPGWIS